MDYYFKREDGWFQRAGGKMVGNSIPRGAVEICAVTGTDGWLFSEDGQKFVSVLSMEDAKKKWNRRATHPADVRTGPAEDPSYLSSHREGWTWKRPAR